MQQNYKIRSIHTFAKKKSAHPRDGRSSSKKREKIKLICGWAVRNKLNFHKPPPTPQMC